MDEILEYEKLVRSIVNKYDYYGDKEDLYQAGMIGLMKAMKEYKPGIAKFSSYAYTWIIGEITSFIRENQPLKKSKDIIRLSRQIEHAKEVLRQKLGREPTDLEVSLVTEIWENKIAEIKSINQKIESLDLVSIDEENNLYNSVKTYDKNLNSDYIDLKDELNKLEDDERKLIYARYFDGYTQSEISKYLGISQVQVSRKETKILQKLKWKL